MKKLLLTAGLLASLSAAAYEGRVYVDGNQNGRYDAGERVLSGVCVSDGLHVTRTDRNGAYSLPGHERERFIFITTPSGYTSDSAHYRRIEPTKERYDFGLQPYAAHVGRDGAHRFIQISDTEIGGTVGNDDWVEQIRNYAANEGAAFVVHTGDICYPAGLRSHIRLMNSANMGVPMYYCIGNHDLVSGPTGEALFEALYGPVYYSFDVGSVHYIVTPMRSGDYAPGYTTEDVYAWLANDLAQQPDGKPIVVFNHDLLTTGSEFRFYKNETEYIDLDAHNLKAWIYGHWHINHIRRHGSAYSVCTSTPVRGGIDHASSAFRVFTVDGNGDFRSELRYSYLDKALTIASIGSEQWAPLSAGGTVPLSVNTYSTVSPTVSVDYLCRVGERVVVSRRPLTQQSDFNWRAEMRLPSEAVGQLVTVRVEAAYGNGERAVAERSFRYTGDGGEAIALPSGAAWPTLGGNASHTAAAADTLSAPLRLRWTTNVGSNLYMCSPVVAEGRLFVATTDENNLGRATVTALDALEGRVLWQSPVEGSVKNTIALSGGCVVCQDIHGTLYAFDQRDGRLVWRRDLGVGAIPALNDGLTAEGDTVYAGTGRGLCAVVGSTGEVLWVNDDWNRREGCTATLSVGDSFVIGHSHWDALHANDKHTGRALWHASAHGLRNRSAAPAVVDGKLYLASGTSFFVLDGRTGTVLARRELNRNVDVASTPLVTDTEIIFGTATDGLLALDRETLDEKWLFATSPALIYSSPYTRNPSRTVETTPILSGERFYFGASDGCLYAVNRHTGALEWRYATGAPIFGSVSVVGNALYAVDFGGNVYGFVSLPGITSSAAAE